MIKISGHTFWFTSAMGPADETEFHRAAAAAFAETEDKYAVKMTPYRWERATLAGQDGFCAHADVTT